MKHVLVSDCEGPISKNDNAFEIASNFLPDGDKLFTLISKYDDVLAGVLEKADYSAGSTLKLILPFLKAYEVTDAKMDKFCTENLVVIANSEETLQHVKTIAKTFIVSTSYEHYIRALCQTLAFPYEKTYCTKLTLDKYFINKKERMKLKEIATEIIHMNMIEIPPRAEKIEDFLRADQKTIGRLNTIFWSQIARMDSGRIFSDVITVGGRQKAESIKDMVEKEHVSLENFLYVGDSITDVEAFQLVRKNGGLTVSFNGNHYAVGNAEIAILSEDNLVTAIIVDVFCRHGKKAVLNLIQNWNLQTLERSGVTNLSLLDHFFSLYPERLPKVQIVTTENMMLLAKESSEFRKRVRGDAIGRLG